MWWVMGNRAPENNGSTTEGKGNYVRAWGCRKPDLAFCEPEGAWHKFSLSSFPEEKLKGSMMGVGVVGLSLQEVRSLFGYGETEAQIGEAEVSGF